MELCDAHNYFFYDCAIPEYYVVTCVLHGG